MTSHGGDSWPFPEPRCRSHEQPRLPAAQLELWELSGPPCTGAQQCGAAVGVQALPYRCSRHHAGSALSGTGSWHSSDRRHRDAP